MNMRGGGSCNIVTINMRPFLDETLKGNFGTTDLVGMDPREDARALHPWLSAHCLHSQVCTLTPPLFTQFTQFTI